MKLILGITPKIKWSLSILISITFVTFHISMSRPESEKATLCMYIRLSLGAGWMYIHVFK